MDSGNVKIGIIGGLDNGRALYEYFVSNRNVKICFVVTYPDDEKAISSSEGIPVYRTLNANEILDKVPEDIDFIFVAGWSGLLNDQLLSSAREGVVGFHPSKLPIDRGRSVLAWQIEEGYTETALSMFYYCNLPDGGDLIAQEPIPIRDLDDISNVLDKVTQATINLIVSQFPLMRVGMAQRVKQDHTKATVRRLRKDSDSMISWDSDCRDIYNKVRAITKPYPGAIATLENARYRIWKVEILDSSFANYISVPIHEGELVAKFIDGSVVVKARDGFIKVVEYETEE